MDFEAFPKIGRLSRNCTILYEGVFTQDAVDSAMSLLAANGSRAAPGFMQPEGIVIYHHASKNYFKKTLEKDEAPKGQSVA